METNDTIATLAEILGMEPAMLRRAVEAARARNDEAGLSALMMRAADAKMAAGLTDNIRRTVRGEQAGAFSVAICMEWNALYEQALTAAETALSEVTHQRDVFRSCLRRAAESVSAHPLSGSESADALVDMVQRALAEERQKREEADEALRATYRHCYDRDPVRIDAEAQGESIREYVNACHEDDARLTRELASECARADRAEAMLSEWDALAEALDGREKAGAMRTERDEARHALDECRAGMWEANDLTSLAMSEGLRQCGTLRRMVRDLLASNEASRERAEKVVEAARVASDWGNGGVEHGARCAAYNGQIGGSPYICKCGMDMLRAALAAYEEGR